MVDHIPCRSIKASFFCSGYYRPFSSGLRTESVAAQSNVNFIVRVDQWGYRCSNFFFLFDNMLRWKGNVCLFWQHFCYERSLIHIWSWKCLFPIVKKVDILLLGFIKYTGWMWRAAVHVFNLEILTLFMFFLFIVLIFWCPLLTNLHRVHRENT